ncbi:MAG: hypothetical protein HYZ42_00615 [Bacteroidetes bacterium]|nr:hypothetical protein [Bacteroidota bacterium]
MLNLSRGGVVNTADLTQELLSGKVLGCMLDVLENEKLNTYTAEQKEWFDILTNHPKTLLSPHVAGWTDESYERISAYLLQSFKMLEEDLI